MTLQVSPASALPRGVEQLFFFTLLDSSELSLDASMHGYGIPLGIRAVARASCALGRNKKIAPMLLS